MFKFTIARDRAGTEVFLIVGDGAEALEAGACVGDFDGECEGDWAKVDIEENPSFNTPPCLQVFKIHLGNLSEERKGLWVWGFLGILR